MPISIESLCRDFQSITGLLPEITPEYEYQLRLFVEFLRDRGNLIPFENRKRTFLTRANRKFRLSGKSLKQFYRVGAEHGITFNYRQKEQVQLAFDSGQITVLEAVLDARDVQEPTRGLLLKCFASVSEATTIEHIKQECRDPSKLREYSKLRKLRGNNGVSQEIVRSQLSAFLFESLPLSEMHSFFDPKGGHDYIDDFWIYLQQRAPSFFNRLQALHIVYVNPERIKTTGYNVIRSALEKMIRASYDVLNNHAYLCFVIPPLISREKDCQTQLIAELMLFTEKHVEACLKSSFFQPKKIQQATEAYVGRALANADFQIANEGFTYRDCFVIAPCHESMVGETMAVLLFQKNRRDETLIPCPSCRSSDVQGNSYPILGVKSWECNNVLCPDRSKYNRGKRYSFRELLMQRAINDPANEIPKSSIRLWTRDIQYDRTLDDIIDMLVRHYSLVGDTIHIFDWPTKIEKKIHGRTVKAHELTNWGDSNRDRFWDGTFFSRYIVPHRSPNKGLIKRMGDDDLTVLCGDAFQALLGIDDATFDGAVTSPPYYNAREYSQWPNIYCYLHDMFNINRQVFRTLKPGAYYLYNIFDYFDNEYSVAFSAMGKKRLILSAYTVDLFRRIGFDCCGNITWDKGDIEGKRGFNAGNFSPYYQAPFNCWEHILIFRKPIANRNATRSLRFPAVLKKRAVFKMVRGENTHGHPAPFPDAIPELLISQLDTRMVVLDPFAGSLTTGRVANRYNLRSVCIEKNEEYCLLGLQMKSNAHQLTLYHA